MDNDRSSFIRKTDSPEYFIEKFHHQYESDRHKKLYRTSIIYYDEYLTHIVCQQAYDEFWCIKGDRILLTTHIPKIL